MATAVRRRRWYYWIQVSSTVLRQRARRALAEHQLTPAQVGALFVVGGRDGCLLKRLSRELRINASAVTALTGRMTKAGLLEIRPCPSDGRARRVHLTAAGRAAIGRALPALAELNEALEQGFTEEELAVVARFLEQVRRVAAEEGADGQD